MQEDLRNETGIKVIPNPANYFIEIEFDEEVNPSDYDLKIFNSLGEVVLVKELNENSIKKIDVSSLINGVYIIQIEKESTIAFNSKLVIVR